MDSNFGLVSASLLTLANALSIGQYNLLPTAYPQDSVFENCGFNLSATCNDKMKLFADGNLLATSDDWNDTSLVYIPPNTGEIEIRCIDGWILGGILASSDNGLMTNNAWNCSSDNEATWHPAHELWSNEMTMPEISPAAKWIWTNRPTWTHTQTRQHTTAICKIELPTSQCGDCPPFKHPTPTTTPIPTPPPTPTKMPSAFTPKPGFNLTATCDDKMKLFADGNLLATSSNWRDSSQVMIPANTQIIEIHCTDTGILGGILASIDNGLITDGAWNCSSDNGITWNPAYEVGPNRNAVQDISPVAEWIWTGCPGDWTSKYTGQKLRNKVICKIDLKPVIDGGWSKWSEFSSCGKTCGDAVRSRSRTCSNPPSRNGGEPCHGSEEEVVSCGFDPCGGDNCPYIDKYMDCSKWKNQCESGQWGQCMNKNCPKTCKCKDSIYFIAGGGGALRDMELYHPTMANLSCSMSPPPLNNNWYHHTTFYYNNIIHLYGGNSGTASNCISYNINKEEWKTHNLTTSRRFGHSSTILNKRVYIIGGVDTSRNYVGAESTPLPLTDQPVLTPVSNLDYKGIYQCTAKVDEDTLVITGGIYNSYLSSVIEYNAKTRTTTSLPSLKKTRYNHGCVMVEMDNTKWIIVAGGYNSRSLETTEMLQIGGSFWRALGNLNVARYGHSIAVTQRGVMAMGGYNGSRGLSSVELLDWSAMSWTIVQPSLSKSRYYFGGAVEIPASMFDCRDNGPEECNSYTALTDSWRKIDYNNRGRETYHCDNKMVKKWYRFEGEAGSKLPTEKAPTGFPTLSSMICGTHRTSWMTSSHPTPEDQIVTRKVCFEWINDECPTETNIRVRACYNNDKSIYYVYELGPSGVGCHNGYCALPEKGHENSIYFIAGGYGALRDMELYHPAMANMSCSMSPPPLNNNWYHHTTFYYNNTIHLYGGNSGTASTCISYNIIMQEWKTHTLSTSRKFGHSSVVLKQIVYFIGGQGDGFVGAESTPLPLKDQPVLTPVPNLDYKGRFQCTAKVDEDTLVITGGFYTGFLSSVIEYNTKTRTTTSLPSMKQPRDLHGCAALEMDNTKWIIVAGGRNSGNTYLKTTEMLQIRGSSWKALRNLNVARHGHSIAVTQRGVMAMGGYGISGSLSSVELLDWSTKSWRIVQPRLSESRYLFGGAVEIPASMFNCRGQQQQQRNVPGKRQQYFPKLSELEGSNLPSLPEQLEQKVAKITSLPKQPNEGTPKEVSLPIQTEQGDLGISSLPGPQNQEAPKLQSLTEQSGMKLEFQLKGKIGMEKVKISVDGTEEEFGLTTEWRLFSYPRPSTGSFSVEFLNDIGYTDVFIRGHESQVTDLLPKFPANKFLGCATENEDEKCGYFREGTLMWNGKYTYNLKDRSRVPPM